MEMDEELMKELKETILKAIDNGVAFVHMTEKERDQQERDIVDILNLKGYEAFVEECMIYVVGKRWEKIVMMELTRNTLYFTPYHKKEVSVVIYYILQLISKKYLDKTPSLKKTKNKGQYLQQEIEADSDEDTEEEPRPPPDFSFL